MNTPPTEPHHEPSTALATAPADGTLNAFANEANFATGQRIAKALSASTLVPQAYQGNVANCVIAIELANRIGCSVFMVMQHLAIIQGRPSWSATFLIASVNASSRFTPLRFRWEGKPGEDGWGCRAVAKDRESGEECLGSLITIGLAKAEQWYGRSGSKWRTMPEQMIMYRAAAFWTRVYAPELSLGMQTAEEVIDTVGAAVVDDGALPAALPSRATAADLEARLRDTPAPAAEPPQAANGTAAHHAHPAAAAPAPLERAAEDTPRAPCTVCGKPLSGECVGSMVQGTYVGRHMACQPAAAPAPKAAPVAPPAPQQAPAAPPAATAGPPPAPAAAPAKAPPKPAAAPAQAPAEPKRTRGPNKPKPGATVPASMPAAAPAAPPAAVAPAAKPMPPCVFCGAPVANEAVWVKAPEGWRHPTCEPPAAPGAAPPAAAPPPAPAPAPAASHPVVDPNDPTGQPCAVCGKAVRDDAIRTHTPAGPKWRHPDCPIFTSDEDDLGGDRM